MHCKITTNCISGKIKLLTISRHLSKQTKLQKKKSIICPHISCSNVERKWKQKKFLLILTISFSYLIFCLDIFWKKKQLKMKLLYKSLACLVLFNVLFSVLLYMCLCMFFWLLRKISSNSDEAEKDITLSLTYTLELFPKII